MERQLIVLERFRKIAQTFVRLTYAGNREVCAFTITQ